MDIDMVLSVVGVVLIIAFTVMAVQSLGGIGIG